MFLQYHMRCQPRFLLGEFFKTIMNGGEYTGLVDMDVVLLQAKADCSLKRVNY